MWKERSLEQSLGKTPSQVQGGDMDSGSEMTGPCNDISLAVATLFTSILSWSLGPALLRAQMSGQQYLIFLMPSPHPP